MVLDARQAMRSGTPASPTTGDHEDQNSHHPAGRPSDLQLPQIREVKREREQREKRSTEAGRQQQEDALGVEGVPVIRVPREGEDDPARRCQRDQHLGDGEKRVRPLKRFHEFPIASLSRPATSGVGVRQGSSVLHPVSRSACSSRTRRSFPQYIRPAKKKVGTPNAPRS